LLWRTCVRLVPFSMLAGVLVPVVSYFSYAVLGGLFAATGNESLRKLGDILIRAMAV
jgi:hypothetical protein